MSHAAARRLAPAEAKRAYNDVLTAGAMAHMRARAVRRDPCRKRRHRTREDER